jgi:hypothetical protein
VAGDCECGNEVTVFIKCGEFLRKASFSSEGLSSMEIFYSHEICEQDVEFDP